MTLWLLALSERRGHLSYQAEGTEPFFYKFDIFSMLSCVSTGALLGATPPSTLKVAPPLPTNVYSYTFFPTTYFFDANVKYLY